ncbi:hypothetical protein RESH_04163 [Rhodopirellula europaea SH398]|uniref:Uncharacterized protein n=1 Tax=Rhodopirellula europaea SH398 TaxID=1263868 RepID=M5SCA8_9BACT|nr:hypothetical protein RESH_04163 [Rhodopirellula europaea SH398]
MSSQLESYSVGFPRLRDFTRLNDQWLGALPPVDFADSQDSLSNAHASPAQTVNVRQAQ